MYIIHAYLECFSYFLSFYTHDKLASCSFELDYLKEKRFDVSVHMSHVRMRNRLLRMRTYVAVTYVFQYRILHMYKQYEIFTSYKIAENSIQLDCVF